MPTVTVLAPDSALAMDEVIRQLGDNAYILATNTRDGQVEILATNDPNQIQPPRKRTASVSFSDILSERVVQGDGGALGFKSSRLAPAKAAENAPRMEMTQGATVVSMERARARLSETPPASLLDPVRVAPALEAADVSRSRQEGQMDEAITSGPQPVSAAAPPLILTSPMREREAHDPWVPIEPNMDKNPAQPEPKHAIPGPSPLGRGAPDLRPILQELGAQLARLEASFDPQARQDTACVDPLLAAGFSAEIITRLAPEPTAIARIEPFITALSKTLVASDPMASLRAPVVVIVGPSGAGKTILAGKIAALMIEIQPSCAVELVSLSETPRFADTALPIYARMLSVPHRSLQSDQLDAGQWPLAGRTDIIDTNLDADTMQRMLQDLRDEVGHNRVSVLIALPMGSSPGKIKTELEKYQEFNPMIALTKLDECELSPQEASQIAETGTQIAWLSGTRALTETIAPTSEEMMTEFLTGLLAVRS